MKNAHNRELFEYYNERAAEYEAFYYGKFPAPHPDPDIYNNDRKPIERLLPDYIRGKCIDIACGTGFWLPFYHRNCVSVTLIDQSDKMLAECMKKIDRLEIRNKVKMVKGDIFIDIPGRRSYDSAIAGFLISHFNDSQLAEFFKMLKSCLAAGGRFVIIDSLWSKEIKTWRKEKAGVNTRALFDGREFQIYKRFFTKKDLRSIAEKNGVSLDIIYWGKLFFMAAGQFL